MGYIYNKYTKKVLPQFDDLEKKMELDEYDGFLDVSIDRWPMRKPDREPARACISIIPTVNDGKFNVNIEKIYRHRKHLLVDEGETIDHLIVHDVPPKVDILGLPNNIIRSVKNLTIMGHLNMSVILGGDRVREGTDPFVSLDNVWFFGSAHNFYAANVNINNIRFPVGSVGRVEVFHGTNIIGLDDLIKNSNTTIVLS